MPLLIANRRTSATTLNRKYDNPLILDVTSGGIQPWVRFSPFYPHGNIPVPFSPGQVSASVEGIWQALKVFEKCDVDPTKLAITNMKGIKRSVRRFGRVLGHRAGLNGTTLLSYLDARKAIYLPSYRWVLEDNLHDELSELKGLAWERPVVLPDFTTNASHAALIKRLVEGE